MRQYLDLLDRSSSSGYVLTIDASRAINYVPADCSASWKPATHQNTPGA